MRKACKRGQKCYNQKAWSSELKPGDHVLIQNLSERGGPGKIRAYWENKIHIVKERRGKDSPVVTPLDGEGRERVLHRNLLLPCPYLIDGLDTKDPKEKHKQKRQVNKQTQKNKDKVHEDSDSCSEEEYLLCVDSSSKPNYLPQSTRPNLSIQIKSTCSRDKLRDLYKNKVSSRMKMTLLRSLIKWMRYLKKRTCRTKA